MTQAVTDKIDRAVQQLEKRVKALESPRVPSVLSVNAGTITLLNDWAQTDSTSLPVMVVRYADGRVDFEGSLNSGSASVDTAFTLPEGWRPSYNFVVPVYANADRTVQTNWIEVRSSGNVELVRTGTPSRIDIETVRYTIGLPLV